MAASRPGGGVMAISVQFRPMPDREWTYSCWPRPAGDPRPPVPAAALLVGFVRRTPAGRWIARAQIAQPVMSKFADRVGAAKWILLAGGYARHPATQTRRIAA
jgi:hypothetical protein